MSLHHILDHHIFPPRPLPSQRRPTVNQGGGSTGTTTVSTELVARCIRAADPTSTDPSITFTTSDTSLTQLSSLLIRLIRPDANAPTALSNILLSSNTQIEFDVSVDEVQQYSLVRAVYITSTLIMMSSSDIFLDGERPGMAAWESASPTVCGHGPSDFEVRGVDDYGLPCQLGIQWEWKREVVLLVFLLKQFWRAAASEDGVVLSLDQNGSPKLEAAGVARLDHHILKWCGQVILEMDANLADKVVLSSWDTFILFHRISPTHINISHIITRDPNAADTRDPTGSPLVCMAQDWTPLKLLFALLLSSLHPSVLRGYVHEQHSHLNDPISAVKRKKTESAEPSTASSGASDPLPELGGTPLTKVALQLRFDTVPMGSYRSRHHLSDRDWSRTTWSSLTKNSLPPFIVTSDSPRSPTPSPERTLTSQPALDMVSKPGLSPVLSTDVHLPTEAETPHPITPRIPLKLISHISSGRISDVFQATLSTHPVVIKLVDLESFTTSGEPDQYDLSSAQAAVTTEIDLYLGQLSPLQGKVVPRCHAVYIGETHVPWTGLRDLRPVIVIVLDDVGRAIAPEWQAVPVNLRQRVLNAYKTLHAAGILHRDLEPRHVRIDREGGIRLIDFEGADFVGVGAGEIEDEEAELRELLAF